MGFLWSVISHIFSNFVSVLFRIVKKLLIVHISVIPTECLRKDSKQKSGVVIKLKNFSHSCSLKSIYYLLCNNLRFQVKSKFLVQTCSTHCQMLHEAGKSIAVSVGFVPEKLEVGKNSALEKLDLLFFFF